MGSFTRLTYHIVFGTKFRRKSIRNEIVEPFYEFIGGTIRNRKGSLIQIGGIEDHLHLLVALPPTITVADAVRDIKANASKWINENRNDTRNASDKFEWQIGYGAFTVSYSHVEIVQNYILSQREHHRTRTFEEEYIELLKRHNIKFERKYLFEAEHVG
jgi:putative transposase